MIQSFYTHKSTTEFCCSPERKQKLFKQEKENKQNESLREVKNNS